MLVILLLSTPLAGACLAYALRRYTFPSAGAAFAAIVGDAGVILLFPPGGLEVAGIGLEVDAFSRLFVLLALAVTGAVLVLAWEHASLAAFAPAALVSLSATLAAVMVRDLLMAILLLEAAGFLIVLTSLSLPDTAGHPPSAVVSAVLRYFVLMTLAAVFLTIGLILGERYGFDPSRVALAELAVAALAAGVWLRVGMAPFHLWVPGLAQHVSLPVFALVTSMLGAVAVAAMLAGSSSLPMLAYARAAATDGLILVPIGAGLLGSLLAFAQTDLRRLLGYAAASELAYVFAGIVVLSPAGITAAVLMVVNYSAMLLLMTVSVGSVQRAARKTAYGELGGLCRAMPVTALGFIVASLGLVGLPPFGGFPGKYLLYQAAGQGSITSLLLMAVASAAGLAFYLRAIGAVFLGPERWETVGREGWASGALIVALVLASLVLGLYPQPVADAVQTVVEGLPLV